jgi:hypothetical protein
VLQSLLLLPMIPLPQQQAASVHHKQVQPSPCQQQRQLYIEAMQQLSPQLSTVGQTIWSS